MRDPVTLTISRKGKEGVNKRESGKMERYVSWPCHNVRTMFIEQPASLSLPRSSSENQSRKEKKNEEEGEKTTVWSNVFLSHPFDKNASLGKKLETKSDFEKRKKNQRFYRKN